MHAIRQKDPSFPELGDHRFETGDAITFTHGLVDIHSHGRDNNKFLGPGMTDVLSHSIPQFALVLLMPNLAGADALDTPQKALAYYDRARRASRNQLAIVVTVLLTQDLTEDHIKQIAEDPRIAGVKFLPAHGTTNSAFGLRSPLDAPQQLEWMEKYRVCLLAHGQTRTHPDGTVIDEYDREPFFYGEVAPEIDRRHPELETSYEHLATAIGAQAVIDRKGPTLGTFTILHLGYTRTDVLDTGVRTDMVMKPMVQHAQHLPKLWEALKSRPDRFALGSDDAWHPITGKHAKNVSCGACVGPYCLGYYLDLFEKWGALHPFGQFACVNAARFHRLTVPLKQVTLMKGPYTVADTLSFGSHKAQPLHAGETRDGWNLQTKEEDVAQ